MRNHSTLLVSIAIAVLIVVGSVLRAWPILLDRPLWYDEVRTWQTAHDPAIHEFFLATIHKEHPPLSYLFVRVSTAVFGAKQFWAMRFPSLFFGILCIPAAFALGRSIHSTRLGLALSVLVTTDPLMIEQSQQARMYTLFVFLLLFALSQAAIAFRAELDAKKPWIFLGCSIGLIGWTHQLAIVVWTAFAIGIAFFVAYSARGRSLWTTVIAVVTQESLVFGIAALVNLPPLAQLVRRLSMDKQISAPAVTVVSDVFQGFASFFGPFPFSVVFLGATVVGLAMIYRIGERALMVTIAALALITLAVQFPLAQVHHQFSARYLLPLLLSVWIGLAALTVLPKRLLAQSIGLLIAAMFLFHSLWVGLSLTFAKLRTDYHYGAATEFIMQQKALDELLVFYPKYLRNFAAPYEYIYGQPDQRAFITYKSKHEPEVSPIHEGPGIWAVVASNEYFVDPQKKQDLSDSLARFGQRYGHDFAVSQVSDLPPRGPLILHFDNADVRAWKVEAIDEREVDFIPLPVLADVVGGDE